MIDYLIYCFLEIMYPRNKIDACKPWPVAPPKEEVPVGGGSEGDRELERFGTVRQKSPRKGGKIEDVAGLGLGTG